MALWAVFKANKWVDTGKESLEKNNGKSKAKSQKSEKSSCTLIEDYISQFPKSTQQLLQQMRETIKQCAPAAEETIGYGIPTFKLHGNLVHFAGYDHHIGFYPGAAGIAHFTKEIAGYKHAKGSVQFPLTAPLPLSLVEKITRFRVKQNEAKAKKK